MTPSSCDALEPRLALKPIEKREDRTEPLPEGISIGDPWVACAVTERKLSPMYHLVPTAEEVLNALKRRSIIGAK